MADEQSRAERGLMSSRGRVPIFFSRLIGRGCDGYSGAGN